MAATLLAGTLAGAPAAGAAAPAPRAADFRAAAARHHVPAPLLLAVGWTNTHWRMAGARDGGRGTMHLRPAQVRRAARLTGRSPAALRRDARANVDGGAALLAAAAPRPLPRTLTGWRAAVERVGGGPAFAAQVYATLARGAQARVGGRRIVLPARPSAARGLARASQGAPGEEPGTSWVAASPRNLTAAFRPADYPIDKIVIHETEGSYAGTIGWFANPRARASAAFVVRSVDGAITQMVREHDIAWHAGNWPYNTTSIGIEHEGYGRDCSWNTDEMYRGSAQLVARLAAKYAIPVDRAHILGHADVPDPYHPGQYGGADHHTDPGRCWDWDLYLGYVRQYRSGSEPVTQAVDVPTPGLPGYRQVVDNGTPGRFRASRAWTKSRRGAQGYLRGYFTTTSRPKADAARFKLRVPQTGNYTLYARWPASRRNSASVPVAVATTTGVRFVRVDQRRHGGRWRRIGTFQMPAGDAWSVQVSRWTRAAGTVVADAVQLRAAP